VTKDIFPSHHCRHCGDKRTLIRLSLKRWKLDKLLEAVRNKVLEETEMWITVECYSSEFRAKKHLVDQCFAMLNREGLLSQAYNSAPHDSTRDVGRYGDSAWQASLYTVIKNNKL
jgi:hypothetical protein